MTKHDVLKKYFGYDSFRTGQEALIDCITAGQDVLGIMPTGAGKSICYQIPALLFPGITLVISPLISLMKDQVHALNDAGIHAAYINSSLSENQIRHALANAKRGQYKIIYVAPERLETQDFMNFIQNVEISMITVDEAHCISQWGQDFRPSYLNIVRLIDSLKNRPVVTAFTATATEKVQEDIRCVLKLVSPHVLVTGFNRENLYFEVQHAANKDSRVVELVKAHAGESGIIYCATRKNVEAVYALMKEQGIGAAKYHAGMANDERKQNQEAFIYDENPVMVATNAFGMGIDKSNVRFVIHYNMPQSMENYYQEAGRAGRDGERAECILLYSPQDVRINQFLIDNKEIRADITQEEGRAVLERDRKRLHQMSYYCKTKECLRMYILDYFGEKDACSCGNCSNCLTEYEEADMTIPAVHIIGCIRETQQRFGINMIVDILRGAKTSKLLSHGFDRLKSYGLEKGTSENRLKQVINEMILRDYLSSTEDRYAVIKLTENSTKLLKSKETFLMKISAENDRPLSKKKQKISDTLNAKDLELFERLRRLRSSIAKDEGKPPYIVCSDKTLADMCIRHPFTKQEMLQVSGIGDYKYAKYGELFLKEICRFCNED